MRKWVTRMREKHVNDVSRTHTYIHTYIQKYSDFLVYTISVGLAQARPNEHIIEDKLENEAGSHTEKPHNKTDSVVRKHAYIGKCVSLLASFPGSPNLFNARVLARTLKRLGEPGNEAMSLLEQEVT